VTYQEAGHVLVAKRGVNGLYDLEDLLALIKAEIIPHDMNLAALSLDAFRRYGKGIDPKARLNFCDCATYALAKAMNAPLLFKGDDSSRRPTCGHVFELIPARCARGASFRWLLSRNILFQKQHYCS
jgi:uncharacterized protein with PIN domain